MSYTNGLDDPSAYFQTALYTGNGGSHTITNDGNSDLQPDWLWIKARNSAQNHQLHDSTRGADKGLNSNNTNAEYTDANAVTGFTSDGFTMNNSYGSHNSGSNTYVAWQWKANGGTTASNSDGSITSTVQANTTAGFSIVTYTGNATAGATVGHGLGAVPNWIIVKDRDAAKNWVNYHESIGNDRSITLNTSDAQSASTDHWANTSPTSSVFSLGDYSHVNANSDNFVAYCFAEKQGYSKFGSYTGNGNADGPFIYTGFKVAWVMIKRSDNGGDWAMMDNKRPNEFNVVQNYLKAQENESEQTDDSFNIDIVSNGFKVRYNNGNYNADGGSYIYMAFAESPFVGSDGVPTTAR